MAVQTEITRISTAKADIKTAIEAKGVTVPSNVLLDTYDDYVAEIGNQSLIDLIERDITSIEIPSGVTTIGDYAFQGCTSLTTVTVPATVTDLGDNCFYNCTSLERILMLPTTPPTEGLDWAANTNNCPIYVPDETVETYKTSWTDLASRIQGLSSQPLVYDFTNATAESEKIPVDSTKTRSVYISKNGVLNGWMTTEYDGLYITGQYVSFPYFIKRKVTDDVGLYNDSSQNRGLSIDCQGFNTIKIYNGNNLDNWTTTEFFPYIKNCVSIASNAKTKTLKVNEGFETQHIDLCVFQHITISRIELYNT